MLCLVAQSCPTLCDSRDCSPPGSSVHGDSLGKNTGVGCHAPLQRIFPNQGSNPGLPHFKWILYHLSHQGSPRIMQWVTLSLLQGSSWSRNRTEVACIAGRFFTSWATKEVQHEHGLSQKVSSAKGGWSLDRLCQINAITVSTYKLRKNKLNCNFTQM